MVAVLLLYASLVNDVRSMLAQHDLAAADRAVRASQAQSGATPETAAALSWLARGELDAKAYDRADAYASEARNMTDRLLRTRKLDSDAWLPVALGASIEVHAQVLVAQGEHGEAITYLRSQLAAFAATSIGERIRKNLNLLNLEGKPAPPLAAADFIGAPPPSLASLRGHPILLFFWAHWCPDCKQEAPVLVYIERIYAPRGLVMISPTKLYGYVAGGNPASPTEEKRYIETVRRQYYAGLSGTPVPLDAANFLNYGASTTPTLVLIDRKGMVRYYHPGAVSEPALAAQVEALLAR
jgi:thiol-disulfide isomerase/thioredoxin